ncbi:hypothetical protein [Actinoplanes sp. NPDC051851]|uniref:hypothetical protein n=1 Tax=Actinoplanes sp. NPDC051851 TaxID=3154753 RepID=UPI003441A7FD
MIRAEWIKMWSVRAPAGALLVLVGSTALFGAMFGLARARQWTSEEVFDPAQASLACVILTQIAAVTLGVLSITAETATATIRSTLAARPQRARLLAAKALLVGSATLVTGVAASLLAFLAGQPVIADQGAPRAFLTDPGVPRAILGGGLYLCAAALIGLALGVLLRSTAAAITTGIGLLLLIPLFASAMPATLARWVIGYWPSAAGLRILTTVPDPTTAGVLSSGPWPGFALLAAATAALLLLAAAVLHRRDL